MPTMKIWIVLSGIDFEDSQKIEGCFQSFESAKIKLEELKNEIAGEWKRDYHIRLNTKEKIVSLSKIRSNDKQIYIEIQEYDLLP
jgi:hypothetical protein